MLGFFCAGIDFPGDVWLEWFGAPETRLPSQETPDQLLIHQEDPVKYAYHGRHWSGEQGSDKNSARTYYAKHNAEL